LFEGFLVGYMVDSRVIKNLFPNIARTAGWMSKRPHVIIEPRLICEYGRAVAAFLQEIHGSSNAVQVNRRCIYIIAVESKDIIIIGKIATHV